MRGRTCGADRLSRLVGSGARVRAVVSIRLRARQRTTALSVLEGLNHELEATSHPQPTRRVANSRPPIHQRARAAAQPHPWQRSRRQSGAPASIATRSAQSCIGSENADSSAAMDSLIRYRITAGGRTPSSNGSNSISAASLRPTCASSNLARPRDHRPSFRRGSFFVQSQNPADRYAAFRGTIPFVVYFASCSACSTMIGGMGRLDTGVGSSYRGWLTTQTPSP